MNQQYVIPGSSIEHIGSLNISNRFDPDFLSALEKDIEGNEVLIELFVDMLKACLNYTRTVAEMTKESLSCKKDGVKSDEYRRIAEGRGRIHNRTISSIKIFCRNMNKCGIECNITEGFGDNRSAYGKFALQITFSRLSRFNP